MLPSQVKETLLALCEAEHRDCKASLLHLQHQRTLDYEFRISGLDDDILDEQINQLAIQVNNLEAASRWLNIK